MKIICCGDSFFSLDKKYPNTHLSELLANKFGAKLQNYSKYGASNFMIALQLEYAIKQNPNLIIFGFTSVDRIEVPYGKYLMEPDGILNVKYELTNRYIPDFYMEEKTTIVSNSFSNLEKTEAIKLYMTELYDSELKRHHDFFIVSSLLRKLDKLGINYMFTRGGLTGPDWTEWSKNEVDFETECPWHFIESSRGSGVYHTNFKTQQILADKWFDKINYLYNFV